MEGNIIIGNNSLVVGQAYHDNELAIENHLFIKTCST